MSPCVGIVSAVIQFGSWSTQQLITPKSSGLLSHQPYRWRH